VVIGAGVIGLAVARALALAGREVLLLEAETHPGTITSARNSGVIHAGLYYTPGSFKARFCVAGNRALYAYCKARGVDHRNSGKLIVANGDEEEQVLLHLLERANQNDVDDVRLISGTEAIKLEPELRCTAALLCPTSGIVDQHPYMLALQGDMENAGGTLVCDCRVEKSHAYRTRLPRCDRGRERNYDRSTLRREQRGTGCGRSSESHRRISEEQDSDDASRPRQLFHRRGALSLSSISSIRCRTLPVSAFMPHSIWANACASVQTWSG
jgi:hypothetical protein